MQILISISEEKYNEIMSYKHSATKLEKAVQDGMIMSYGDTDTVFKDDLCNYGRHNTGYCNTGDHNSGKYNTGNGNSGNCNVGSWNWGNGNTGCWNPGFYNVGNCNSGSCNAGDCNFGNHNAGNWNSGDWNSGHWNSGNRNYGVFNTINNSKIKMFDKASDWTFSDWYQSRASQIMECCPYSYSTFISGTVMTDKEKREHLEYKTTGGYVKVVTASDSDKQKWWDNLPREDKEAVMGLPNFNASIFKECTGIDVN